MKKNKVYFLLAIILSLGFVAMLVVVCINNGEPLWIDRAIQNAVLDARNETSTFFFRFITFFSDPLFIIALILILLIVPKTRKNYGMPLAIIEGATFAGYSIIKELVARARPDELLRLAEESSYSFPSGHAVSSFVVYGLLIYLIDLYMENKKLKNILTVLLVFYIIIIPISRVYLCVHWPTDIIAGWFYAAAVLVISIGVLENRRRKRIERQRLGLDDQDEEDDLQEE